jgi:hypothetical protein
VRGHPKARLRRRGIVWTITAPVAGVVAAAALVALAAAALAAALVAAARAVAASALAAAVLVELAAAALVELAAALVALAVALVALAALAAALVALAAAAAATRREPAWMASGSECSSWARADPCSSRKALQALPLVPEAPDRMRMDKRKSNPLR